MLEALEEIDWKSLRHAYGSASDVPEQIRGLISGDGDQRTDALESLYQSLAHQGEIYEAAAYATPFLIELLREPDIHAKHEILRMVRVLGSGGECSGYGEIDLAILPDEFPSPAKAAHDAVESAVDVYVSLLADSEIEVRIMATYAAAICVKHREEVLSHFLRRLDSDAAPVVRAGLLLGIGELLLSAGEERVTLPAVPIERCAGLMRNPDEAPLVRLVAALVLMHLGGPAVYDESLGVVRATQFRRAVGFASLPWFEKGSVPFTVAASALAADGPRQIEWLFEGLEQAECRRASVYFMERLCSTQPQLADALSHRLVEKLRISDLDIHAEMRQAIADALTRIGEPALPALQELQGTRRPKLRALIGEIVQTIEGEPPRI